MFICFAEYWSNQILINKLLKYFNDHRQLIYLKCIEHMNYISNWYLMLFVYHSIFLVSVLFWREMFRTSALSFAPTWSFYRIDTGSRFWRSDCLLSTALTKFELSHVVATQTFFNLIYYRGLKVTKWIVFIYYYYMRHCY